MDIQKFSGMKLVSGGSPLGEDRTAVHSKSECKYYVFDENGAEIASFSYVAGDAESEDKAWEDALEVVSPDEKTFAAIEKKISAICNLRLETLHSTAT